MRTDCRHIPLCRHYGALFFFHYPCRDARARDVTRAKMRLRCRYLLRAAPKDYARYARVAFTMPPSAPRFYMKDAQAMSVTRAARDMSRQDA